MSEFLRICDTCAAFGPQLDHGQNIECDDDGACLSVVAMSDCSANARHVLADREPGVLYIHGASIPGLDYADYKAIEVDGHRFERVRECHVMSEYSYYDHTIPEWNYDYCSNCGGEFYDEVPNYCPNCGAKVKVGE